ncbi:rRNA biogenesis protein rrp5 [uncultured Acetobacterium sp.]|uniref:rRNA biogenesis protein rrp5 n=1 Tax=uncultured Acetobacterium sp. TaxID=217139 RepID=UPI0025F8DCCB|nr:rRNA biogenesis protein rrp5 [uncultured Acetobacterium sp.]
MSRKKRLLDVISDVRSLADSLQAVVDAMLENEPVEVANQAVSAEEPIVENLEALAEIKLEDVRAVLADKSRMGHTAAVRELLTKYGASKLSEIDPQKYPALLKDAEMI